MSSSRNRPLIWSADPHTIAKIAILRRYLGAWFQIFGRSRHQELMYIDGFAGPGEYSNSAEGSPVAAIKTALSVIENAGQSWVARGVHFVFMEKDARAAQHLRNILKPYADTPNISISILNCSFDDGIKDVRRDAPWAFSGQHPLFAFIDPFGPTEVPFSVVRDLLATHRSEVLINLDADGFVRTLSAGEASNADAILTVGTGDDSWREVLNTNLGFRENVVQLVQHYKNQLLNLPGVNYAFPFEMLTSTRNVGTEGYFLMFASQHPRGLERMKEAMRSLDQDGSYRFSDARVGHQPLFKLDRTDEFSKLMHRQFLDQGCVPYCELNDFALNETPYINPNAMLKLLDGIHWVIVGGESGPGARPMEGAWVEEVYAQCRRNGVPFFFKQWGGIQKHRHGRELFGRTFDEMPLSFQVRENPHKVDQISLPI